MKISSEINLDDEFTFLIGFDLSNGEKPKKDNYSDKNNCVLH